MENIPKFGGGTILQAPNLQWCVKRWLRSGNPCPAASQHNLVLCLPKFSHTCANSVAIADERANASALTISVRSSGDIGASNIYPDDVMNLGKNPNLSQGHAARSTHFPSLLCFAARHLLSLRRLSKRKPACSASEKQGCWALETGIRFSCNKQ